MMRYKDLEKRLKIASKDDYETILQKILPTPLQEDILNLRFKGYDPVDFPDVVGASYDAKYLKSLRRGERLKGYQICMALNITKSVYQNEKKTLLAKIEYIKMFREKHNGLAE